MMPKYVLTHFKKHDLILYNAIVSFKGTFENGPELKQDLFSSLCRTIAGQQLSGKAADAIWNKFTTTFPRKKPTARGILDKTETQLRETGFSYAKIRSLKDLSERVSNRSLGLPSLHKKSEEDVREELQKVVGIGPWTSEMFLMFALGREDVFSVGDLGLKKAVQKIYALPELPTPVAMQKLSQQWSPYRTHAACALWTILDNR